MTGSSLQPGPYCGRHACVFELATGGLSVPRRSCVSVPAQHPGASERALLTSCEQASTSISGCQHCLWLLCGWLIAWCTSLRTSMWLATPTPQTSETRFPRAAAASVDRPSRAPKVTSICSPATSCARQACVRLAAHAEADCWYSLGCL